MPPRARKAPARAPRKAPAKTAEQKIAAFDALRQRAAAAHTNMLTPSHTSEPLTLGKEEGFDPPLVARFPSNLADKVALDVAARGGHVVLALQILLGDLGLMRAVAALSSEADSEALLIGLHFRIMEHFLGPGATDVPGGTPAS